MSHEITYRILKDFDNWRRRGDEMIKPRYEQAPSDLTYYNVSGEYVGLLSWWRRKHTCSLWEKFVVFSELFFFFIPLLCLCVWDTFPTSAYDNVVLDILF